MSNRTRLSLSKERLALLGNRLREEGLDRTPVQIVIPRADKDLPAPLTVQQTQMWFLDHLMTGATPYVILGGMRVRGTFDHGAFAEACRAVALRHDSLRTVFLEVDGRPMQAVLHDLPPEVAQRDLGQVATGDVPAEIRRRQHELAVRPFDLAHGPLLRVELLRFGHDDAAVLFGMHHIVSDLWSMGVLMREVTELYASMTEGRTSQLAPLSVQYPDFAIWQAGTESETGLQADLSYWVEQLRDVPAGTGLVTDRPRPDEKSYRGASVPVVLAPGLVTTLRALAQAEGCTSFMVLTAAFDVLLARLSGSEDIVVGTPVAGRPLAELEPLIGYFVNTVALRTDVSGNPTFRELLHRVTATSLDAFHHQSVPFERVVAKLRPDRSLSRNPIFQVMFSYQNAPLPSWDSGPAHMEPIAVEAVTAKFDLQLDLIDDGPSIWGRLVYSTDLFDAARAEDMAMYLLRLLNALARDPDQRIGEVPLLSAQERTALLAQGRGPQVVSATADGVHELVTAWTTGHPDDIAVVAGPDRIAFGTLDQRSDQLAHQLRQAGVGGGSVVGLCLPTGVDLVVAVLGVWKSGAAYLPLDPDWPRERSDLLLGDSGSTMVIAHRDTGADVGDHPVMWLDDLAGIDMTGEVVPGPPRPSGAGDRVAYVIYTSGSTGRPKGVQVTHAGLLSYLAGVPGRVGLGEPGWRYALLQGAVTDFANTIIFTSLVTGGELHILDRQAASDPEAVADYLAREEIDCVKMVPSHLAALSAAVGAARLWPARALVLGGEAASVRQVTELCEVAGGRSLFNHYGPTETTIGVATTPLTRTAVAGGFVPIGTPVPNTALYVLDARGEPVPPGVAGELYVGGAQVARGYLNRPELTAERFVDDPFAADSSRMYRTGDRMCWTAQGDLRFLGRVDDQVKIRGFRVEPQEIEAVLAADPEVGRAVVIARQSQPGTVQLVAYVTQAIQGSGCDPARLRAMAARALPDHMVPAVVVTLEGLPLASNGKVDRAALPAPDFAAAVNSRPPHTPAERVLCEIFALVLGLPEVGAEDRFFELGGDSIQAIQLVSRARAAGLALNTRDVFVHQTVAALAKIAVPVAAVAPVVHDDGIGLVAPTPALERLRALGTSIQTYSHRVVIGVPAAADLGGLTTALRVVMEHHGALRARLDPGAGGPWSLRVAPSGVLPVERYIQRVDVAGLAEAEFRPLLTTQTGAAVRRLDPYAGIQVQAVWFDAGREAEGRLLLVVHHVVVDGVSWRVLLSDLRSAWEAASAGFEAQLPAVGTSLRAWAGILASEAMRPERVAELAGWRTLLRDVEPVVTGAHDPAAEVRQLRLSLPAADAAPLLSRIPSAFGVGVQDVLLAAFGIASSEWQRQRRGRESAVVVEVEGHGRREDLADGLDLTRSVGWFTSVYPVRMDAGTLSWQQVEDADAELRHAVVRLTHQLHDVPSDGLGFGLLRHLNAETAAELAAVATPQIVFNYLGRLATQAKPRAWEPMTGYAPELSDADSGLSPLLTRPLHLNTYALDGPDGPQLVAEWTWPAPLLDEQDVASLAEAWLTALRAIVTCADRPGMALLHAEAAASGSMPRLGQGSTPLSFAQLNSVYQPVGSDNAHHNVIAATVLRSEPAPAQGSRRPVLDEAALGRSLDRIAQRHEVLRTRIVRDHNGWTQAVSPTGSWPVRSVDLRSLDQADRSVAMHEVIEQEQTQAFALADGRPMRTTVVRTAEDEWVLIMVLHHIVIDPWGYAQLQVELAELYEADVVGREPNLPELMIQYPDFAARQQAQLADGTLDRHVAYWATLLEELPALPRFDAPAHQCTTPLQGFTAGFVLDERLTEALKDAARGCGVTLFMILLSAYHALQSIYSDSEDVLVTFPLAGREQPETQNLIGYFINEVVVRTRAPWDASFRDLTAEVRDGALNGHEHQDAPLRTLHHGAKGEYDPFRIMFNLVNYQPFGLDLFGLTASFFTDVGEASDDAVIPEVITAMRPHNLDLYLAMHERDGRLNGLWLYSPEVISPTVMAAMTKAWPVLLEAVVRDPDRTLRELRRDVWESTTIGRAS